MNNLSRKKGCLEFYLTTAQTYTVFFSFYLSQRLDVTLKLQVLDCVANDRKQDKQFALCALYIHEIPSGFQNYAKYNN